MSATTIALVLGGLLLFNLLGLAATLQINRHYRMKINYLESTLHRTRQRQRRKTAEVESRQAEITALTDRNRELERSLQRARRTIKHLKAQYHGILQPHFRAPWQPPGKPLEERRN